MNERIQSIATWILRLAQVVSEASTLQKRANAIETTAEEVEAVIDTHVRELQALLQPETK